jgi:predicted short-subunit dehydrogenase-like oxidoreductase (DUF2520 family)
MIAVFLIGCGAVGRSLGAALLATGRYRVIGAHDPIPERAELAGRELGVAGTFGPLPREATEADLVVVAAPNDALHEIAASAFRDGACAAHQIWLHCDGSAPASALGALAGRVRGLGVSHPARVFPPGVLSPLAAGCVFALSGDAPAIAAAEALARDLGGIAVRIDDASRPAYHAAAVMAANCAVALLAEARDLLVAACGLPEAEAERLVVGLAGSAVDAARRLGLGAALSGPIRRGDAETVRKHLAVLEESPSALEVYRVLGRAALAVARTSPGYPPDAAKEIAQALDD